MANGKEPGGSTSSGTTAATRPSGPVGAAGVTELRDTPGPLGVNDWADPATWRRTISELYREQQVAEERQQILNDREVVPASKMGPILEVMYPKLPPELEPLYHAYVDEMGKYIEANRPTTSGLLGLHGTGTNFVMGVKQLGYGLLALGGWAVDGAAGLAGKDTGLSNSALLAMADAAAVGCVNMQAATFSMIVPKLPKGWLAMRIGVGHYVEHHSVVVYKEGTSPQLHGYAFDPWVQMKPKVWTYAEWSGVMYAGLHALGMMPQAAGAGPALRWESPPTASDNSTRPQPADPVWFP
jgi:hypothetical protein